MKVSLRGDPVFSGFRPNRAGAVRNFSFSSVVNFLYCVLVLYDVVL